MEPDPYTVLKHPPLHFVPRIQAANNIIYDTTNKEVVFVIKGTVFSEFKIYALPYGANKLRDVNSMNSDFGEEMCTVHGYQDVLYAACSPHHDRVAVLVSDRDVAIIERGSGTEFVHSIKVQKGKMGIQKFFWIDNSHMVLATGSGYDFVKVDVHKRKIKSIKSNNTQTQWHIFSPEYTTLVCGTGKRNARMAGYIFIPPKSVEKLRKFELSLHPSEEDVTEKDVYIVQLYGGPYLVHLSSHSQKMDIYNLDKDPIDRTMSLNLYSSGQFALSVIDNLLLVHNLDAKLTLVFDIRTGTTSPVAPPMSFAPYIFDKNSFGDVEEKETANGPGQVGFALGAGSFERRGQAPGIPLYSKSWNFFHPKYLMDTQYGLLFEIAVDLEKLSVGFQNKKFQLIEFLLKRSNSKRLILSVLKQMVEERESLSEITRTFNLLNRIYYDAVVEKAQNSKEKVKGDNRLFLSAIFGPAPSPFAYRSESEGSSTDELLVKSDTEEETPEGSTTASTFSPTTMPKDNESLAGLETDKNGYIVVEEKDIYLNVFYAIEEEKGLDFKFLVSVVIEYMRSLHFFRLPVQIYLHQFLIYILVKNRKYHYLHQFLQYHVISDSSPIAFQLLSLETDYHPAFQLGIDMLSRIHKYEEIIEVLLSRGMVTQALHMIGKYQISNIDPRRVLDVAYELDSSVFYAAYIFYVRKLGLASTFQGNPPSRDVDPMFRYRFKEESGCKEYEEKFRKLFLEKTEKEMMEV